jgi:hypothetical protein
MFFYLNSSFLKLYYHFFYIFIYVNFYILMINHMTLLAWCNKYNVIAIYD